MKLEEIDAFELATRVQHPSAQVEWPEVDLVQLQCESLEMEEEHAHEQEVADAFSGMRRTHPGRG